MNKTSQGTQILNSPAARMWSMIIVSINVIPKLKPSGLQVSRKLIVFLYWKCAKVDQKIGVNMSRKAKKPKITDVAFFRDTR